MSKKLILLITLILFTSFTLLAGRFTPVDHRPVYFHRNHITSSDYLKFKFDVSEKIKAINYSYAFEIRFPEDSFEFRENEVGFSCNVYINDQLIENFESKRNHLEDPNSLFCQYTGTQASGVEISMKTVTLQINDMKFKRKFFDEVNIGLVTTTEPNRIIIVENAAFKMFALHGNYKKFDAEAAWKITDARVINNSNSLSCQAPCDKLYPYSEYEIEFSVLVNDFVDPKDAFVLIGVSDINDDSTTVYSVSTSAYTGATQELDSFAPLKSTDKSLKLERYLEPGRFVLTNIGETADPGRRFNLRLSGFVTNDNVNKYANKYVRIQIHHRNSNGVFSYFNYDLTKITYIYPLAFLTAGTGESIGGSVFHPKGADIYENGAFPLQFKIRIPKVNHNGRLYIENVSTGFNLISFVTSTCDFSNNEADVDMTQIGTRPICSPTRGDFNNGAFEGNGVVKGQSSKDNGFFFSIKKKSENRDVVFTVWAIVYSCDYSHSSSRLSNIFNKNFEPSMNLVFNYKFFSENGNIVAESQFVTTALKCYQSQNPSNVYNNSSINDSDSDNVLYNEFYEWNFASVTHSNPTNSQNPEPMYQRSITNLSDLSLNQIIDKQNLAFYVNFNRKNLIDKFSFPIARTSSSNSNRTLMNGYMTFDFLGEYFEQNTSTINNCYLKWFTLEENGIGGTRFAAEETISNQDQRAYRKINSIDNFKLKTNNINGSIDITENNQTNTYNLPSFINLSKLNDYINNYTNLHYLGFYTDCYSVKSLSSVTLKSLFSPHLDITIKHYVTRNSRTFPNRVTRLLKFFPGKNNFSNNTSKTLNTQGVKLWNNFINYNSSDQTRLCVLTISGDVFNQLDIQDNTILITLTNIKLPVIDDFNELSQYPVGNAVSGIKVYPMYYQPYNYFEDVEDNGKIHSATRDYSNNYDTYFNVKSPFLYFGSNLLIRGIANKQVTANRPDNNNSAAWGANEDLYIPVHCLDQRVFTDYNNNFENLSVSFNFLDMSDVGAPTGNVNTVLTTTSNRNFALLNTNFAGISFAEHTMNVQFEDFRQNNYQGINQFSYTMRTANPSNRTYKAYAVLLLTNLLEAEGDIDIPSNQLFFGQNYELGQITSHKIGHFNFERMYFNVTPLGFTPSDLHRFSRPAYAGDSGYYLNVQGVFISAATNNASELYSHITNANSNHVVSYPQSLMNNEINEFNEARFSITFRTFGGLYYINDFGANFTFEATIFSDLRFENGELNINVNNYLRPEYTRCVLTSNPQHFCNILDTNNINCQGITVESNIVNTILVSCYNLVTGNTGKFTVNKNGTYFDVANYINYTLFKDSEIDYIAQFAAQDISTIVPKISKIDFTQVKQQNGLANGFIQIDLGRGLRLGQQIMIKGAISDLYINKQRPNCWYSFTDRFSNLESITIFDEFQSGNNYIKSCEFNINEGEEHVITIMTKDDFIPVADKSFSRFLLIKLDPVFSSDLAVAATNGYYSIESYLEDFPETKICADPKQGADRDTFPPLTPSFPILMYQINKNNLHNSLCNVVNIFPRLSSVQATYFFDINLSGATVALQEANLSGTNKVINEVSIYFDRLFWQRTDDIYCSLEDTFVPCVWNEAGFINIRFYERLIPETIYRISIQGITTPKITEYQNSKNFLCSVNYNDFDIRENILVGQGSNRVFTYEPETKGNLLYLDNKDYLVSNHIPGEFATYKFRFSVDTTENENTQDFLFTTDEYKQPLLYVNFPSQYSNYRLNKDIRATLTYTRVLPADNIPTENYAKQKFSDPVEIKLGKITGEYNYVKIMIDDTFVYDDVTVWFDLQLSNVANPKTDVNTTDFTVTLLDDEEEPSVMFYSYSNLNTQAVSRKDDPNSLFDYDFWQGPSFIYDDNSKYLIKLTTVDGNVVNGTKINITPGRYSSLSFSLIGNAEPIVVNISLNKDFNLTKGSRFDALENNALLDNNKNRSAVLRVGVPCKTLYGNYAIRFNLSSTENLYNMPSYLITVNQIVNNIEQIRLSPLGETGVDLSAFVLYPSVLYLQATVDKLPFEDVKISLANTTMLYNNFRNTTTAEEQTINAKSQSASFAFKIDSYTDKQMQIRFSSGNKCYGFGNNNSKVISFEVSLVIANMNDIDITQSFFYRTLDTTEPVNRISVVLGRSIPYTMGIYALMCDGAAEPTYQQVLDYYHNNKNVIYSQSNTDNSPLAQVKVFSYTNSIENQRLNFDGLKRGQTYKLKTWMANMDGNNTIVNVTRFFDLPLFANKTQNSPLKTVPINDIKYFKFDFEFQQTEDLLEKIVSATQYFIKANSKANIVVYSEKGQSVNGYRIRNNMQCSSKVLLGNNEFKEEKLQEKKDINSQNVANQTDSTSVNGTSNNTGTLRRRNLETRYLQTNTTQNTTTNSTTNTTIETDVIVTVPEKINYTQSVYIKLVQDPYDTVLFNFTDFLDKYHDNFQTEDGFRAQIDDDKEGIALFGRMTMNEVRDQIFSANDFNVFDFIYNNVNTITYQKSGLYNYDNCYWKLSPYNYQGNNTFMPVNSVADCKVNSTTCGQMQFSNATTSESLVVGELAPGKYYVNFGCRSKIPISHSSIAFRSSLIEVLPPATFIEHNIFYNCTVNNTLPECLNSSSYVSTTLMALLFMFLVMLI